MGNIVILVGSMRKGGNTDLLAQAFAEGARENHSVEIIRSIHVLAVIHVLHGKGISAFKMMIWMGYMKS